MMPVQIPVTLTVDTMMDEATQVCFAPASGIFYKKENEQFTEIPVKDVAVIYLESGAKIPGEFGPLRDFVARIL